MSARKIRGFTLIELMMAIAIIGIIAAIAYPSFQDSVRKSRRSEAIAEILRLQLQQEKWRSQNVTYSADIAALGAPGGSVTNFYDFAIFDATATTYTIAAKAKSTGGQDKDRQGGAPCGLLSLNQSGTKGERPECWR